MIETRFIDCAICDGDGGFETGWDGQWRSCKPCDGEGEIEVELEPLTLDDITSGDYAGLEWEEAVP